MGRIDNKIAPESGAGMGVVRAASELLASDDFSFISCTGLIIVGRDLMV